MTPTIYSQIAAIAKPIIRHFHTDLTKHDRDALRSFKVGDSAVWACYECGSHMVRVSYSADIPIIERINLARRNCEHFFAVDKVFGRQIAQWYLLEGSKVRPISVNRARQFCEDKLQDLINSTVRRAA